MSKTFSSQIAADDTLWTFGTDEIDDLRSLFANPYEWVKNRVQKTLAPHFVMQFSSFDKPEAGTNYLIQGIDNTALITIRYSPDKMSADLQATGIRALDEIEEVLDVRLRTDFGQAYSHYDWGSDPNVIAERILLAAGNTAAYLAGLSGMDQAVTTERGTETPTPAPNVQVIFSTPLTGSQGTTFVYEGMEEFYQSGEEAAAGDPPPPPEETTACSVTIGTFTSVAEPETHVEVNTIIIKSYMFNPDPGP